MKTLHDWVKEARKAAGPEAARCLRTAEPLVERGSDWSMLAEAWAALGGDGHDDARRCAEQAVAHGDREVFVYLGAAAIHARELHDLASARRALDRCFEVFAAAADVRVGSWRHLAGGYAEVLGDAATARRCLERGEAPGGTTSVEDLCVLADGYIEHLDDKATARALVDRAMALVEATPAADLGGAPWTLANLHRFALRDPEAAWRILERGLERAITAAGCLAIARAMANHAEEEPVRRPLVLGCVTRAERLASTTGDWIAIAGAWHEQRGDPADIRRCLEQALAHGPDDAERTRIASGHRHWLEDAASADRLSARGVAPAALVVTRRCLEQWQPDPSGLLDWLRGRITPDALARIAAADFGFGRDTHLAALRDIQATGLIPQPLEWHPREVLELIRWRDGENIDHTARAFACTVLCLDAAGPSYRDGHEQTMAVLLESCLLLGDEATALAPGLMVTLVQSFAEFRAELGFAYLGLLLAAAARDPHDPRLAPLADRLVAAELETRRAGDGPGWLLGQTRFDLRHGLWRLLAEDLLAGPARGQPSLAHLAAIAERLRGSP
jgi:hypothetical protein